ncbi:MAG: LysE family translocator [Pseudomonadota bacterium]
MEFVNFQIVLAAAFLGGLTPGPVSLAIAGTGMRRGRVMALTLAYGASTGSVLWALAAALGFGALLAAHQWLFELIRYAGAGYLMWLAWRAARSAMTPGLSAPHDTGVASLRRAWMHGALLHLANPKAVVFWGSIFAIGMSHETPAAAMPAAIGWIVGASLAVNVVCVTIWALVFSAPRAMAGYARLRRVLEGAFATFFAGAALKLATTRLQ